MSYIYLFIEFTWMLAVFALIIIAVLVIMGLTLWEFHVRHKNPKSSRVTKNKEKISKKLFAYGYINKVFDHYFSNSNIGLLVYDENLKLLNFNSVFTSIVGYTKDKFLLNIGETIDKLIVTSIDNNEILKKIENRDAFKTIVNLTNTIGDVVVLHLIAIPVFSKNNTFNSYNVLAVELPKDSKNNIPVANDSKISNADIEKIINEKNDLEVVVKELEKAFKKSNKHHIQLQKALLENEMQRKKLQEAFDLINKQKDELEKANAEIKEHSRMKELFLANTSHEIRTPLNSIIGFSNLLLKEELSPKQLDYLKNIKASSDNLLVVLNDILDISKIEAGKMTFEKIAFSLPEIIDLIISFIDIKTQEKKQKFNYHLDPNVPKILIGDPTRLYQILLNLLSNAIKFTPSNGNISCSIKQKIKDKDKIKIEFEVSDTGIGMSEEQLKIIFQAFTQVEYSTTRKFGGTGLGLSIVKNLVELQGGEIFVESEIDKGTKFTFVLPFGVGDKSDNKKTEKSKTTIQSHEAENIKILLVEDNPINQELIVDTIKAWNKNISIKKAENGMVAIDLLTKNNYSLIFMDIQMPLMDGIETTKQIREGHIKGKENIPIIAMTAHALKDEKDKCFAAGMNDYITKPFNPDDIFKIIKYYGSQQVQTLVKAGKYVQGDPLLPTIQENNSSSKSNTNIESIDNPIFESFSLDPLNEIYNGNIVQINKILRMYYDTVGKEIEEIKSAFASGDLQKTQIRVHSLKPKMAYLGRTDIEEIAKDVEVSIKTNSYNNSDLSEWIDSICSEYQKIENELENYFEQKTTNKTKI